MKLVLLLLALNIGYLSADLNEDGKVGPADLCVLAQQWLDSQQTHQILITVDHTKVNDNLTDYPLYISGKNMPELFWENVSSDGHDIYLESQQGQILLHELASFDRSKKLLELYVKLPTLSSTQDTTVKLNFGDFLQTHQNSSQTWDDNFKFVSHLNDTTLPNEDGIAAIGPAFESNSGSQGLATKDGHFYWGKNEGDCDGTIYKLNRDGKILSSFPGPCHACGGDFRKDRDTLMFNNAWQDFRDIWEIDSQTGEKIRSWQLGSYGGGGFVAAVHDNTFYITQSAGSKFRIHELNLYDYYGMWDVSRTWECPKFAFRCQGFDAELGYSWLCYDYDLNGCITIAQMKLNGYGIEVVRQIKTGVQYEGEGLAFDETCENLYFGSYPYKKIYCINNPLGSIPQVSDTVISGRAGTKYGFDKFIDVDSKLGKAQLFDGKKRVLAFSDVDDLASLDSMTIEVWAKLGEIDDNERFVDLHNSCFAFKPYYDATAEEYKLGFWNENWVFSDPIQNPKGLFHHYVISWDGQYASFYYDGEFAGKREITGTTGDTPNILNVGAFSTEKFFTEGVFDDVRISNTARSSEWIQATYSNLNVPSDFYSIAIPN